MACQLCLNTVGNSLSARLNNVNSILSDKFTVHRWQQYPVIMVHWPLNYRIDVNVNALKVYKNVGLTDLKINRSHTIRIT